MIYGIVCINLYLKIWENNVVLVSFVYYNKVKIILNRIINRKCLILK